MGFDDPLHLTVGIGSSRGIDNPESVPYLMTIRIIESAKSIKHNRRPSNNLVIQPCCQLANHSVAAPFQIAWTVGRPCQTDRMQQVVSIDQQKRDGHW